MFPDNRFQQSMFVYRLETYSSKYIHLSHFYLSSFTYTTKNMFLEGPVYLNWSKKVSSFSVTALAPLCCVTCSICSTLKTSVKLTCSPL